jgi:hypothetical protein
MVWKAIGLCTISELEKAKTEIAGMKVELTETKTLLFAANDRAGMAEARYDNLVERIATKAQKPDDGIIHAKNSGDVRRIFEQQISAQEAKRDKEMEN